jgi:serine/threonine-protein kinase
LEPTAELGRYQILGEIGRGSSGIVYHARDTLLGREVALKSVRPPGSRGVADDDTDAADLRAELLREARSAGMLSHPNVVTIYDVLEGADGTLYIAMEYVEGRSLADVLAASGPLDFERVVDLVSHIAAALDYLHAMGLVHRDVKPANILIASEGRVKMTDFGIAVSGGGSHLDPDREPGSGEPTHDSGAILGTPNYMAPEQILGREITPRTDVWSLGVVLYEMLAGRRPFDGRSVADVVHRIVHGPVPELGEEGDHPARLRELLERALAKDPRWRFPSAGDLARDLRKILYEAAGEAGGRLSETQMLDRTLVALRRPAPPAKAPSWRRGAVAAVLLAALLGVAAFAVGRLARGPFEQGGALAPEVAPGRAERHAVLPPDARGAGGLERARTSLSARREPGAEQRPAAEGMAQVTVQFSSDAPEGVLTIYGGGEQLLQRGFSYYEPGWLLGKKPSSGGFEEELEVPPNVSTLWVYVARPGTSARRLEVPGRYRPGDPRVLRVHLPAEGDATAVLR